MTVRSNDDNFFARSQAEKQQASSRRATNDKVRFPTHLTMSSVDWLISEIGLRGRRRLHQIKEFSPRAYR
jgi:hypothetical protein